MLLQIFLQSLNKKLIIFLLILYVKKEQVKNEAYII